MKNNIMKMGRGALFVAFMSAVLTTGCEKEKETMTARAGTVDNPELGIRCDPYRDVVGHWALCADLIQFANCMRPSCTNAVYSPEFDHSLGYVINSAQTVNVTLQTAILNAALAWAAGNAPSGYAVQHIGFYPGNPVTQPNSTVNATIGIKVLYYKCLGGGPVG